MEIKQAIFHKSSPDLKSCPESEFPEFAFIGRSNVGKSSLINMLVDKKGLAKTSSKPGKTKLINYFTIDDGWFLVDLPGYGYAKISKKIRENWEKRTRNYLENRDNLVAIFVLIDSRIAPQKIDLEFMEWLSEKELPYLIVFTKCDKISGLKVETNIKEYQKELLERFEELPIAIKSSSKESTGKDDILGLIESVIGEGE